MKILIVILCLLLSGCKIDYSLRITNKNEFVEKVDLSKYFPDGDPTAKDELGENTFNFIDMLRNDAYGYLSKIGYSNYKMTNISSNKYQGVRVNRTYSDPNSYNYNLLIKNLYDEFSVIDNDGIITIFAKGFNREKVENRYEMLGMTIDNSSIMIELPYKVIENNADMVDREKNIYTWYVDKNTTEKEVLLKYDVNDIYALNMKTIGTKINMNIVYIVLVFLILIVLGYLIYAYVKRVYENLNKF